MRHAPIVYALLVATPSTVGAADPAPVAEAASGTVRSVAGLPAGIWKGDPDGSPVDSTFVFEIDEKEGRTSGTIHILHAEISFPIERIAFVDDKLTLDLGRGDSYVGELDARRKSLAGTLTLMGVRAPLKLERVAKLPVLSRPQYPKPPYSYESEDVVLENAQAKVKLAGTLTVPKGTGPFPAVVLVSGSGPHDRDGSMYGHRHFLVLADHLTRHGIACLRIDDRGVGKSEGDYDLATGGDFASDAYACVKFLQQRKEVDSKRIGICGHSEGGVSGPLVAVEHPDEIAFVVLLATVGVTGEELLYEQTLTALKSQGIPIDPKHLREYAAEVATVLRSDKSAQQVREEILKILRADEPPEGADRAAHDAGAELFANQYSSPGRRWLITRDPEKTLKRLRCPVLAMGGSKDTLCHAKRNLEKIEQHVRAGGNTNVTCVELPNLNHLFQTCKTGMMTEYPRLEETFAPAAMNRISDWILKTTRPDDDVRTTKD